MDAKRFDSLTRMLSSLSSRRITVSVLLGGGLAGVFGLAAPEEGAAHNPAPACKKIKGAQQRLRCRRRARAHNRRHPCRPEARQRTCAGRCGTVANNCRRAVTCPCPRGQTCLNNTSCCTAEAPALTCAGRCGIYRNNCANAVTCPCAAGKSCISNGSCAQVCIPDSCPPNCGCSIPNVEGPSHCVQTGGPNCEDLQECASTTLCPLGYHCQPAGCGNRCVRLCQA